MTNPILNLEFDLTKGEFKPISMDAVKDLPHDKLYFAFEILQQWLMGQHMMGLMQRAQAEQAKKPILPGPQIPGRNIFVP